MIWKNFMLRRITKLSHYLGSSWIIRKLLNFTKSANNDYTSGFSNIGYFYLKGYGTDKDYERAFLWYTRAIDRGANNVFHIIGSMYSYGGYGVKRNYKEALAWFTKGTDRDNSDTEFGIGELYRYRTDKKQDYQKSLFW
jgi:TPR repeat protein